MHVGDFDFDLPPERIALRPALRRDAARLLVVHPGGRLEHRLVSDLPGYLRSPDRLVVNDSKVFPARLSGLRQARAESGPEARIELTLHRREAPDRYAAFGKPARRVQPGDRLALGEGLEAVVEAREGPEIVLRFSCGGEALDRALERVGEMPLPPYIAARRPPDARDREDYQTVYAAAPGSVAAPTAGLHFTPELLDRLEAAGIGRTHLTLHVGAGTFLPVTAEDTADHRMHPEWAEVTAAAAAALNATRAVGGRIAAVGTTALRTLESAATEDGAIHPFARATEIFITPGYRFRTADILLTNFHLPRSTLFMLVSAFMGLDVMRAAYAEAIREGYRFYSYGDACLLLRRP